MNDNFATLQGVGPFEETVLPIGYVDEDGGAVVRNYTLKNLTGLEIRKIRDFTLARRRPYTWLARAAAIGLETLGGKEVVVPEHGVPSVVKRLTIRDAEYLIIASHVHNYGPMTDFRFQCIECGAKERKLMYDLSQIDCTRAPEGFDPSLPIRIHLQRGISLNGIKTKLPPPPEGYNFYDTRIPTVDDLMGVEHLYRKEGVADQEFTTQLLATCGVSIGYSEVDEETGESSVRDEVSLNPKLTQIVLDNVAAIDWRSINGYVEALPGVNRIMRVRCPECGAEVDQGVDPTTLFLVGS